MELNRKLDAKYLNTFTAKSDSLSILNTSQWDKNLKKSNEMLRKFIFLQLMHMTSAVFMPVKRS